MLGARGEEMDLQEWLSASGNAMMEVEPGLPTPPVPNRPPPASPMVVEGAGSPGGFGMGFFVARPQPFSGSKKKPQRAGKPAKGKSGKRSGSQTRKTQLEQEQQQQQQQQQQQRKLGPTPSLASLAENLGSANVVLESVAQFSRPVPHQPQERQQQPPPQRIVTPQSKSRKSRVSKLKRTPLQASRNAGNTNNVAAATNTGPPPAMERKTAVKNTVYRDAAPPGVPPPQPPPPSPSFENVFVSAATFASGARKSLRNRKSWSKRSKAAARAPSARMASQTSAAAAAAAAAVNNRTQATRSAIEFTDSSTSPMTPRAAGSQRKIASHSPLVVPQEEKRDADPAAEMGRDFDLNAGADPDSEPDFANFSFGRKSGASGSRRRSARRASLSARRERFRDRDVSPASLAERHLSSPVEPEGGVDLSFELERLATEGDPEMNSFELDAAGTHRMRVDSGESTENNDLNARLVEEGPVKARESLRARSGDAAAIEEQEEETKSGSRPEDDSFSENSSQEVPWREAETGRNHAKDLLECGELDAALEVIEDLLRQEQGADAGDETHAESYFLRSSIHLARDAYPASLADCLRTLQANPRHSKAAIRGARILRKMGCFTMSADWLRALANMDSTMDQAREELGRASETNALFARTVKLVAHAPGATSTEDHLRALVDRCPGWPCARLLEAVNALWSGREQGMLGKLEHARNLVVETEVMQMDAHGLFRGRSSVARNCGAETAETIAALLRSLHHADFVQETTTFVNALIGVFEEGSPAAAGSPLLAACRKEASLYASLAETKEAANALFRAKEYTKAVARYKDALNLDPEYDSYNAIILCNRAAAYMAMERFESAVADCSLALKKLPSYAKARVRRARANERLGKLKVAMSDMEQACEESPSSEYEAELERLRAEARRQREAKNEARNKARWGKYERKKQSSSSSEAKNEASARETCLYKVLGVASDASQERIRKAYLKLALKYHPDKRGADDKEAVEMFKVVADAYETLKDPVKKAGYDRKRAFSTLFSSSSAGSRATSTTAPYYYSYF